MPALQRKRIVEFLHKRTNIRGDKGEKKCLKNVFMPKNVLEPDQFKFLGNCRPTPPLSEQFSLSEKKVSMLA